MSKNILITGINGFVGSAAASYFLKNGYHVVGLLKDINHKTQKSILDQCSIVVGDVRDKDIFSYILSKYEIDYILHLAAQPIVRICDNDPYTAYYTNIIGTLNLLEAVRNLKHKPQKLIVLSSDKVFGDASIPYTEKTPLMATDTYCTSKVCQDLISVSYAKTYKLPICIIRSANIYGPGDLNYSRLVPNTIIKLLNGESPIIYSGVMSYLREFLYIDCAIDAFDFLLHNGVNGEVYNISSTEAYTVSDVIHILQDKIDPNINIKIIKKDFYDIPKQRLDISKIKKLGWESLPISFNQGLDYTIDFYKHYQKDIRN